MTTEAIILKAKTDLEKLLNVSNPTPLDLAIAKKIIETVFKTCGPMTANQLIKDYNLVEHVSEVHIN